MCTDFLNIIITASLLTTSLSQAPHAPSHGNAFQALTCSLLLSQPPLPFCFLHLSTHYSGPRKMSMRGQMFPFSFQILTSQNSCCFPRQVHEPLQFSVVLGHAVRAGSCTDGPKQMQLHHSSQHITQIQNKIRMASVHCTQHSCVPLGTSLDREDRKKWSLSQLLPEEQARTQPPLFTILTTFLSCWLSIQLCP